GGIKRPEVTVPILSGRLEAGEVTCHPERRAVPRVGARPPLRISHATGMVREILRRGMCRIGTSTAPQDDKQAVPRGTATDDRYGSFAPLRDRRMTTWRPVNLSLARSNHHDLPGVSRAASRRSATRSR